MPNQGYEPDVLVRVVLHAYSTVWNPASGAGLDNDEVSRVCDMTKHCTIMVNGLFSGDVDADNISSVFGLMESMDHTFMVNVESVDVYFAWEQSSAYMSTHQIRLGMILDNEDGVNGLSRLVDAKATFKWVECDRSLCPRLVPYLAKITDVIIPNYILHIVPPLPISMRSNTTSISSCMFFTQQGN